MKNAPKVTYRQEGGDDGYCYVVRVNGREVMNGLTRSSAMHEKQRLLAEHAAKQNPIDPADLKRLRDICSDVWQYIGSDCGDMSNEAAIETCFDADRPLLSRNGCTTSAEARDDHAFCKAMYAKHGFDTVTTAVARELNLV